MSLRKLEDDYEEENNKKEKGAKFRPAVWPISGPQPQILLPLVFGSCCLGNLISSPPPIIAGSTYVSSMLLEVHKDKGIRGMEGGGGGVGDYYVGIEREKRDYCLIRRQANQGLYV